MFDDLSGYIRPGKDKKYRQVFLGLEEYRLIGWVENQKAQKGNLVTVDGYDGVWEILTVFKETVLESDFLHEIASEYRFHRKRTDV